MAYGEAEYRTRPQRRWGRRLLIILLVLLVVVGVLLFVADRVGASVAERRITQEVSQQLDARGVRSAPPGVDIGGFPFLTQVLAEEYDSISIVLRDVSAKSGTDSIRLPRLDVVANDVRAPLDTLRGGPGDIVAKNIEGTATVGYASVADLMNQPNLRLAHRAGKVLATLPIELLGQSFTLTGEATITAIKGGIRLRFRNLDAEGLPDTDAVRSTVNGYAKDLSIDVELPPLPFGIEVREIKPLPDGLWVSASGQNVALNQAMS